MQVTINLNWNSSNHTYSLTSSNEKLCQISSDKQSYIIFGKTYTPTVNYNGGYVQRYRLVSYSFASASNVGVSSRSGTTSGSPNTTSNYSSSEVNYYTRHSTSPSYTTTTARIEIEQGWQQFEIKGDTDACDYDLSVGFRYEFNHVKWYSPITGPGGGPLTLVSSSGGEGYTYASATYRGSNAAGDDETWVASISVDPDTGDVSGDTQVCSKSVRSVTDDVFASVYWNATWDGYDRVGGSSSDTGGAGYTYATKKYRKQTSPGDTWYDPDFYSSFSFNATTGRITWSHRGESTTYYNRVEQYSTIRVEDASYYQYNITSLDWNYDGDEYGLCTVIEQTNSHMIIDIPNVGWVFIDETTGDRKEGQLIKFIDETTGTETMIKKVQASNNGILSRYLRTTTKKK